MRDYCKHWYTSCRCRRLAGVGAKLFVVLSLLLFMTASYAQFQLGTARVTSVVPVNDPGFPNPACVRQDTPPRGTEYWDVRQGHRYRVRLEGVTECSGDTIQVHVFNPFRRVDDPEDCYRPQCLEATRVGDGIYEFEVEFKDDEDDLSSKTYYIRYCTNSDCSAGGFLSRRSDGGSAPSLLRLAHFDPRTCEFIREDKTCLPLCLPGIKLRLECNPPEIPDCDEVFNKVREECKASYGCQLFLVECRPGEPQPAPDLGPCWVRSLVELDVIDCEYRFYTITVEINWQEDEEPPVVNNVPDKYDLGCNPDKLPDCDDLIALFGIEAKDNCAHDVYPQLFCEPDPIEELPKCRYRQTFRFWAVDKCGNRSPDYPLEVNWKIDTEPPVVNNVPAEVNLGCNPAEPPSCEWLIAEYGIEAKDNCAGEGNEPELFCEPGPIEELPKCRYRQTFRFWAVDKSECGNRSPDYYTTVTWKIDTEPPVVNNVPREVNLGCNPAGLPSCEWLIATYGIEAKDNCAGEGNEPELFCEPGPIEELSKCRYRQTFRFYAVDKAECGNHSPDYYTTVTWKIDYEPPVVNNVPEAVDLGCNPDEPPSCEWLIATYGIEAKDNCAGEGNEPELFCEPGPIEELSKCRYRQTFRFYAVDKAECGNRSPDYYTTVTWKIDYEPPVVNNVPEAVDLGCNPAELPSCEWLIATYGIEAKDNCTEEGNEPELFCEPGPIEELSKCRYRQTFRFWAVDKSECGNRSPDYYTTVTWKIDYEPPVVNNVPREVNLGCNPAGLPSCEWLIATYGIEAKDNCAGEGNEPELFCEPGPIEELSKCRYRQTFRFYAVDKAECGNHSPDYYTTVTWKIDYEPPVVNNVPEAVDLGCNPDEPPSCEWLIATYGIEAKDNCAGEGNEPELFCEPGPIEELSKCRYRQTFRFYAVDKAECGNRSPDYYTTVTWKIDYEPPVVNNVPEAVDLGCNPDEPPSCEWLIATYGIEAKDNCAGEGNEPELICEPGPIEELPNCRYRQTFRFWAVDKAECGNRSPDYFTVVTWQIDTVPPVINNLPRGGKLPCNTRPSCEYLIERYNIHAKDNCDKEPQLFCEAGEVEQVEDCQFRQTFRFWAVDKCGNRTQDYFVTFFWKEDTEPPVLHNLPEGGDLGCNPSELPTCETIGGGVTATDNCDPNPRVTCFSSDLQIGCLRIRSFNFVAADECGNVATAKVFYYWTVDTTPPVVRCPDNIVVQADPKECFVEVRWRAKADDDCDPNPRLVCDPPSGSLFPLGTTTVTCTATDRCGNTASCSFTVTVLGFICGTKFHDLNGNGVRDSGEPGLPGWTIELVDPATNTVLQTVVTGPDGRYCFLGLQLGNYIVREVLQPGWVNTTPIERRVNLPRDCGKQVDFGNRRSQ
jgi:hypothetical protein